ncbi:MAG: hypothetical protein ACOYES_11240 [Bacillota bacterium]|jgi:hypothetical protein
MGVWAISRVSKVKHKGADITRIDFSNLQNEQEIKDVINLAKKEIAKGGHNSALTLTILSKMRFNTEILNMFKSYLADNKPYVKNGAIVGVDSSILKAAYRSTTSAAERLRTVYHKL